MAAVRKLALGASAVTAVVALAPTPTAPSEPGHRREVGRGQIRFDGHGPEWWARAFRREHRRLVEARDRLHRRVTSSASVGAVEAIRWIFGPYAGQAQRVARCESGWNVYASNGQYLGMFQMGSRERAIYGHGTSPLAQARAAYIYFWTSGRDWSPWTCKP